MKEISNLILIIFIVSINKKAYAYLEPSTITFIFQSIIGGLAAMGTFIYIYWLKIKKFIFKILRKNNKNK